MRSVVDTDAVYKKLKKQNGEGVAHVVRSAGLLDVPDIIHILEFAGKNPEEVKQLFPIIHERYKSYAKSKVDTGKDPLKLLNMAGYDAFVVESEKQKNSIKKYYRPGEELCTFRDPNRHKDYYMIHAVKRDADKIKPSDNPKRDDEYGTSVISIQIACNGGFISIKNRYNHTVTNPDNTFDSNPDKIIPGLSNSLKKYFHVNFNATEHSVPDNFRMVNDQFVRFNHEINNVYFGSDYYFRGNEITKLNNDYEIMLDYFVLDIRNGKLHNLSRIPDGAYKPMCDAFDGKKIRVQVNPENKNEKIISADGVQIAHVMNGELIGLNLPKLKNAGAYFLYHNKSLVELNLPELEVVGDGFLKFNMGLTKINLPELEEVDDGFLYHNATLRELNLPKLKCAGRSFLCNNKSLVELNLPKLEKVKSDFLSLNESLTKINLPELKSAEHNFLRCNKSLVELNLPKLQGEQYHTVKKRLQHIVAKNKIKHVVLSKIRGLRHRVIGDKMAKTA